MGFSKDNIPYILNVGLDISYSSDYLLGNSETNHFKNNNNILYDLISKCENLNIDYIISHISNNKRRNFSERKINQEITEPIFIDDYLLFAHEWKNSFSCKIRDNDVENFNDNYDLILQDLEYAAHVNCRNIVIRFPKNNFEKNSFQFLKFIKMFLIKYPERTISVIIDLSKEALIQWKLFAKAINFNPLVGLILNILPDLPEEVSLFRIIILKEVLKEWISFNVKDILLNFSIFVTNKNGFPVLSK